jgi:flagellar hook assembly protein FlgD
VDISALNGITAGTDVPTTKQPLGEDVFLNLVVTQLRNQNPLEPTSGSDFVAQLAQLGTLEQTQLLNENLLAAIGKSGPETLAQIAQLVGRKIEYVDPSSGQVLPGLVSSVALENGEVVLDVGAADPVPLSALSRIVNGSSGGI